MSLAEVLRANKFAGFPLNVARSIIKQCLLGLSYLHSLSIVHSDLKPDNILLSPSGLEEIIREQLRAERIARLKREESERLHPPLLLPRQPYTPKTPGLSPEQVKQMQDVRERVEREKWDITPSVPLATPIDFMQASPSLRHPRPDRLSTSHPGNSALPFVTPPKLAAIAKAARGMISPPAHIDLPDSGYKVADSSRPLSTMSTINLSRQNSGSNNTSPLLARAMASSDASNYSYGAPLQRYPSRHYIVAKPATIFDLAEDLLEAPAEIHFETLESEMSVQTTATAAGETFRPSSFPKKGSPLALLDTQVCLANLVAPPASSFAKSLVGSKLNGIALSRTGSGSTFAAESGSGSSQNGDVRLSSSFMSRGTGGSSSSLESSFTADSALRGYEAGSPTEALKIRWNCDNTPSQPSYIGSAGASSSSSPIATKYGMPKASSVSMDAQGAHGSVFRPNVIPHPLLAPYQPLTIEDRLRQLALREDALHAKADLGPKSVKSPAEPVVKVKIADLGNALFFADAKSEKNLPTHVCTRYYREPGNIIGAEYDLGIDIFALGCTVGHLQ